MTDLWCVCLAGADDVVAYPSRVIAGKVAREHNEWVARTFDNDDPDLALLVVSVERWPRSGADHARELRKAEGGIR